MGSDLKRYFDFVLSSVLHNTFKIFENHVTSAGYPPPSPASNNNLEEEMDSGVSAVDTMVHQFSTHCILLAEELFDSTML